MKGKLYVKAVLDGFLVFLCAACLTMFLVAEFMERIPYDPFDEIFAAGFVMATVLSGVYLLFLIKEKSNKRILLFSLCSLGCFLLCQVIVIVNMSTIGIELYPKRELWHGDGIAMLMVDGAYYLTSLVLRAGVFVSLMIKNACRKRKMSRMHE